MSTVISRGALAFAAMLLALCLGGCGSPNVEPADSTASESAASAQADQRSDASDQGEGESASTQDADQAAAGSQEPAAEETAIADGSAAAKEGAQANSSQKSAASKEAKANAGKDSGKESSSKKEASTSKDAGESKKPAAGSSSANQGSQTANPESTEKPAPAPAPSGISVSVSIDGCGYISAVSKTVKLEEGASVYDALKACGVRIGGNKRYVSSINGLAEKAHGPLSGWMYSVNGETPMVECGKCKLSAGDRVRWYYVNAED